MKSKSKSKSKLRSTSRFRLPVALLVVALVASIGYFTVKQSRASTYLVTITGNVTLNGKGLAGATIATCKPSGNVTTDSRGNFSFGSGGDGSITSNSDRAFCVRVIAGLPSNATGGPTNNWPENSASHSYEYQASNTVCYHNPYCIYTWQWTFDRSVDNGYNFVYTTPPPTPQPQPQPQPQPKPSPKPAPKPSGTPSPTPAPAPADTAPPSVPANFTASLDNQVVALKWDAATDNVGVDHYELDRSLDQATWTSQDNHITDTTYADTSAGFGATYYYRIRAVDAAGNASDYATATIKTGTFSATNNGADTTISSDDNLVAVTIPAGALADQADCSVISDSDHGDKLPVKQLALISGPYSLLCKKQNGDTVDSFSKPVAVTVKIGADKQKRYKNFSFYSYTSGGDTWTKFKSTYDKKQKAYDFNTNSPLQFAVLGSVKKGLSAQAIILIIMLILLIIGILYFLYMRGQRQNYQRYIRKKYYNL